MTGLLSDVDGCLDIPVIGGAGMEGAGIDVAYDLSSPLCDEVGIGFKGGTDPASEFFFAGDFVFKGDGGLCDVGGIDRKQRRYVKKLTASVVSFLIGVTRDW